MKRWAVLILACLALGVLTTVAIAFSCALWSVVWPRYGLYREISARRGERLPLEQFGEIASLVDSSQLPPKPLLEPTDADFNEEFGFGLHDSNLDIVYSRDDPARFRGASVAARHRAGWPLASLGCVCSYQGDNRWSFTPSWTPPAWLARPTYTVLTNRAGLRLRTAGLRLPMPLRPIPIGFAADSLLFGTAMLGLCLAPSTYRAIRTHLRLRRGLCPACGYDLSGNTTGVCPECGQKLALSPV